MTSVNDFEEYTGRHGVVTVDGAPWLDVEADVKMSRGLVQHARASKFSKIQLPGEFSVKVTLKKALQHSEAATTLGYMMSDTPITGSVHTIGGAAASVSGDVVKNNSVSMTFPSRIQLTFTKGTGTGITTPGQCIVVGTNANDVQITELFELPLSTSGFVLTGAKVFKTVSDVVYTNVVTNGDGTIGTASIAGNAHYVVGDPKILDLTVGVEKGAKSIIITLPDGWFSEAGLAFVDATNILEMSSPFEVHDPDLIELEVVS